MMRLDKFLTTMELGTRSQVKNIIKSGAVSINGTICKNADYKFDETNSEITYNGKPLQYQSFQYIMLNKPADVVSATQDKHDRTVLDLLTDVRKKDLFPVGRLDKDTEGLLLLTNDGTLAHHLLSPKKHVDKTYLVHIAHPLLETQINKLENGVDIGEEKATLPAKVKVLDELRIELTIHEGKFHQVKRMLQAVDNQVIYLKRISFGSILLDETLAPGEYRELSSEEIAILRKNAGIND